MNKITECTYLNDIKGCEVTATYECDYFLETQYLKDGVRKSLVIEFQPYGGSMGYGAKFHFSGVELPQTLIYKERVLTKLPLEMGIQRIVEINRYKKSVDGYGDEEELEIVYLDEEGLTQTYLLDFNGENEDWYAPRFQKNKTSTYEKIECDDTVMPSELFSTAVYKNALAFALRAHGEQKTPDGLPYSFHITSVALEMINSLSQHRIAYDEANVAIACALLHDVLEDTKTTMGTASIDIPDIISVLHGVNALTKDTSLPTKQEQMQDSLKRLQEQPKCVQMVKLADRITNLAPAPAYWNEEKRRNYVKEAQEILDALRGCNPYLEAKLQYRIDHYDIVKNDPFLAFYGRRGEENIQFVLDKSHPKYLKTFKALKKLNEHLYKTYELSLFRQRIEHDTYCNMPTAEGLQEHTKVGISYILDVLNSKDVVNLDKLTDEKVNQYLNDLYDGEGCIVQ
ncbi:MAG: HD domain-containing protein [Sulfurimonas sp.]|jgi:hypothetical protein